MKLVGALMILLSAGIGYLIHRRSSVQTLCLIRAIAEDLALLRCQVCIHRQPLPSVLSRELSDGIGAVHLWRPFSESLRQTEGSLCSCWQDAIHPLPPMISDRLMPLGRFLSTGGETLARVIDEVRDELISLAREQQAEQTGKLRLVGAMCFSAAALFILIVL